MKLLKINLDDRQDILSAEVDVEEPLKQLVRHQRHTELWRRAEYTSYRSEANTKTNNQYNIQ